MSEKKEVEIQEESKNQTLLENETVIEKLEEKDPEKFLEEFDWEAYEKGITESMEEESKKNFEEALNANYGFVNEWDVLQGTVVRITERDAIIDIASKSEGVISLNEFRYNPDLKVGDVVDVLVDRTEDSSGQLILSHKKARTIKAWERVLQVQESGETVNGYVKCRTRGGMIVDIFGIEAFLPGSQIDTKPITDYDEYLEKIMEFKVLKVNHEFKNIVVSHRILIESDIEDQKRKIMEGLEKGQVLQGTVKNIMNYGVFVDLGGVDGLIHITDLSWSRVSHPSEVVALEQILEVVILEFDNEKTRIQLGLKQLSQHPWETLDPNLKVGDRVKAKVVLLVDYGAFVEIKEGVEALIHISEMSWSTQLRSPQDFVKVGDEIETQILTFDLEQRKISLGMKQLHPDPWATIATKYPVGSNHTGVVISFTHFGVFVELEEGIDGLVHIADLSWTKKIKHPSDLLKKGDKIEVKVMELDVEARKLNISYKHTKENPWDANEKKYPVGSMHEGTIIKPHKKGALVSFGNDIEGFVPQRFLEKEDGENLKQSEVATFKIIEFNKDLKRIVASHTDVFKEQERKDLKKIAEKNKKANKSTLGDIDGLADIKKKMEEES